MNTLRIAVLVMAALLLPGCGALRCAGLFRGDPLPPASTALASERMVLEQVWMVEGVWSGVGVDAVSGDVYAMHAFGTATGWGADIVRVDRSGHKAGVTHVRPPHPPSSSGPAFLRVAQFGRADGACMVMWGLWGQSVDAFDASGERLWLHESPSGVDDVVVADIDGDGVDEVIVGFNAYGGLHVLRADGALMWKVETVGNVWGVTTTPGDATGTGRNVVALGGMYGANEWFNSKGEGQRSLKLLLLDPYKVRSGWAAAGKWAVVFTNLGGALGLEAVDLDGQLLWAAGDWEAGRSSISDFETSPDLPLAAAAMRDGAVIVYDLSNGKRLASVSAGWYQRPVWVPGKDGLPELLVVASNSGLKAFVLKEKKSPEN